MKRLVLTPGQWISLQRHQHRCEHWVVVAGKAEITIDEDIKEYGPNEPSILLKGQASIKKYWYNTVGSDRSANG